MASPVNAAFVSFAVGTAALGLLAAVLHTRPDITAAKALPWYAWVGGLYGAIFVVAAAWAVARLARAAVWRLRPRELRLDGFFGGGMAGARLAAGGVFQLAAPLRAFAGPFTPQAYRKQIRSVPQVGFR